MRIVANLDCELAWAGGAPLPAHVRAKLGALGTLLRAFSHEPAELVLCGPVDRARIPEVGPAWREVPSGEAGALRWGAPRSEIIRRVADRRFVLDRRAMIGARVIESIDQLQLEPLPASWIAKAPITAAGRDRVRRRGPPDDATRARLARLLARHGALIVEPWLDRIEDFGQCARVDARGAIDLLPPHRLLVDDGGGFAGIAITNAPPLPDDELAQLRAAAIGCGRALHDAGYAGPFAIDAFAYRDEHGRRRFHALCELNPRLTFGFVARAWADLLGAPLTLHVREEAPPPDAIVLVSPTRDDPTAAWISRSPIGA